jgi:hypothetical protein
MFDTVRVVRAALMDAARQGGAREIEDTPK